MGSSTSISSSVIQQYIQTEIQTTNTYITAICNVIASQAIIDFSSKNADLINDEQACLGSNFYEVTNCTNMFFSYVDNIQTLRISCLQHIISNIPAGSSTNDYYMAVQKYFVIQIQTNPQFVANIQINIALQNTLNSVSINDFISKLGSAFNNTLTTLIGPDINNASVNQATLSVLTQLMQNVNETSIKNLVTTINSIKYNSQISNTCIINASASNSLIINNCDNWVDVTNMIGQDSTLKSTQTCANTYINSNILSNLDVINAIIKMNGSIKKITTSSKNTSMSNPTTTTTTTTKPNGGDNNFWDSTLGHIVIYGIIFFIFIIIMIFFIIMVILYKI